MLVAPVRGDGLEHEGAQRRQRQPARHVMAQPPGARRHGGEIVVDPPLAGDDQHQPSPLRPRGRDKGRQRAMRLGQRHPVLQDADTGAAQQVHRRQLCGTLRIPACSAGMT